MYLFLFLVALPGQFLFGVTTMTMSAVLTTYLFGLCYYALTGTYYFFDSYVPIAVFLGMHLLFTDPSTAPRTDLGRMIFGVLYGISTIALYALLGMAGLPAVLRQAPASPAAQPVGQIDRPGRAIRSVAAVRSSDDRTFTFCQPPQSGVHVELGDRVYHHERSTGRRRSPSWPMDSLLAAGLPAGARARVPVSCPAARDLLPGSFRLVVQRTRHSAGGQGDGSARARSRRLNGAANLASNPRAPTPATVASTGTWSRGSPPFEELPILLRGSKGPITDRSFVSLYSRACDQGWPDSCERIAGSDTRYPVSVPAGHSVVERSRMLALGTSGLAHHRL